MQAQLEFFQLQKQVWIQDQGIFLKTLGIENLMHTPKKITKTIIERFGSSSSFRSACFNESKSRISLKHEKNLNY